MQTGSITLRTTFSRVAAAGLCLGFVVLSVFFAKWAFGHVTAAGAEIAEVAAFGVRMSERDPEARYAYASLLEKTLLPADQARSLQEFEAATALSPNNYVYWLALSRALEQAGETDRAELAVRKAAELAPNYSRVQWALGNILLRQGRQQEAFAEMKRAVASDRTFAGPAAAAAWQILAGDVPRIIEAIGDSPRLNAAIALLLASDKRFGEAAEVWKRVPDSEKPELKDTGQALYNKYLEAGIYRSAIGVATEIGLFSNNDVAAGRISNGGFESALPPTAANEFSWNIADGTYPRIGLNENQKHSGNYSLLISFGQGGKGFRPVSQKVGVEPGSTYSLRFFYRSEHKTNGKLNFKIFTPRGQEEIASMTLHSAADWSEVRLPFSVPAGLEGIDVRMVLDGCAAETCSVSGNVWFDDFELIKG